MLIFEIILVVLSLVTGLVWLLDRLVLRRARKADADGVVREPAMVEYSRSLFPVIVIVLVLRSFIAEPFRIPSSSMMPTVLIGDFILVNKFSYGLRLPVTYTEVIRTGRPERGEVAVFRFPPDPRQNYIKRVVGLPGDEVVYRDKVIYVNDVPMPQVPDGRYVGRGSGRDMTGASVLRETLGGHEHEILQLDFRQRQEQRWVVPEGHYFVMGDNRDNSEDSRAWGFVPEDNLVGRAFMVWMSWDDGGVDFSRIGTVIR
jgi:signal peptidase I